VAAIRDEVDKMKERSEKNNMFIYIIIPAVPFLVSYKGNKEKNLEDVDRFNLTFPVCEYHDKNWTWLDLALAIKQRCKRVLLQVLLLVARNWIESCLSIDHRHQLINHHSSSSSTRSSCATGRICYMIVYNICSSY
jgi:hypothetical protein